MSTRDDMAAQPCDASSFRGFSWAQGSLNNLPDPFLATGEPENEPGTLEFVLNNADW